MKLSQQLLDVFVASELQWDAQVSEIAELALCSESTARYHLQRLSKLDLVTPIPLLNVYRLGYSDYTFLFSSELSTQSFDRQKMIQYLLNCPEVSWLGELGGRFSYGISILAKNVAAALSFIESLSNKFHGAFAERSFAIRIGSSLFGRSYLTQGRIKTKPLEYAVTEDLIDISSDQQLILQSIMASSSLGVREISRLTGLPITSVHRHIDYLRKASVIVGYINGLEAHQFGFEQYKLLLCIKRRESNLPQDLYNFCLNHDNITHLIKCVGEWDYEVSIEVRNGEGLISITRMLQERFGWALSRMETVPELRCLKFRNAPFTIERTP
jgi:DNA-binding MarR family transcriptional regulator